MFSRKLLTIGAPILGMVAIVGSGFSAWHFQTETTEEKELTIELTPIADYGTITFNETEYKVVLDQGGYENLSDDTKGISVVNGEGSEVSAIEIDFSIAANDYQVLVDDGLGQLNVTTYILVKTELAAYVNVTNSDFTSATVEGYDGYSVFSRAQSNVTLSDDSSNKVASLDIDVTTTSLVNNTFEYVADAKPENESEWNSLSSAIQTASSEAIKIVCIATFVSGN